MGSDASAKPAGWNTEAASIASKYFHLPVGDVFNSGHLLARQLGGSGSDPRNLVALYADANQCLMRDEENYVASVLGDDPDVTVFYSATPEYEGSSHVIPSGVKLEAYEMMPPGLPAEVLVNEVIPNDP